MINWMAVLTGTIIGGLFGMFLMAFIAVGDDPTEEIEEVAHQALELANKYANRLVKVKNYVKDTILKYNTEDAKEILDIIDGRDNEWPDTKK